MALLTLSVACPSQDDPLVPPDSTGTTGSNDTPAPDDQGGTTGGGQDFGPDTRAPALVCGGGPSAQQPFAGAELGVRITSPTGKQGLQYSGGTVAIGGVAFGDIGELTWSKADTGQSGEIKPIAAFWQTGGIPLVPGDNVVTVVATSADGSRTDSDTIVITAAPAPVSGLRVAVTPDHVWVGEPHQLRFTLAVPLGDVDADQVDLLRVGEDGVEVQPPDVLKLRDDGDASVAGRCDDVLGDRVFSACREVTAGALGKRCYRVRLKLPGGNVTTPTECVDVLPRFGQNACLAIRKAVDNAVAAYGSEVDHEAGIGKAREELLQSTGLIPVAQVGEAVDGWGVWARFDNGVLAAVPLGVPSGYRAVPVESHRTLLMRSSGGANEIEAAAAVLTPDTCPPFEPSGPHTGNAATLERLRGLEPNGIVAFAGHGGAFFGEVDPEPYQFRHHGTQEVWWAGEPVACEQMLDHTVPCSSAADCPAGTECVDIFGPAGGECVARTAADLLRGRVVMGPTAYAITPAFVDHYVRAPMPRSVIYAGSCYSGWNGSMAMAFLGAGAGAYVGYDGLVTDAFATEIGTRLFEALATGEEVVEDAVCFAADPGELDTQVRLAGSTQIGLGSEGIFNADFELPGPAGWTVNGDGRRVVSFCDQSAPEGKFMGVISTGLGFTQLSGSMSQRFCIPEGTQTLTFTWRYYSAELEVSCNVPGFQDRWRAVLSRGDGTTDTVIRDCTVTDMCAYAAPKCTPPGCPGPPSTCDCGACYEPYEPVAACAFEGQSVMATGFVVEQFNVSHLAGQGPVTLTFSVKDGGQATLDTAVLIDGITLQ